MEFFIKKAVWSLFTIFCAITCIFFAIRFAPGDPIEQVLGPEAKMEEKMALRHELELDLPPLTQYTNYLKRISRGDFGKSLYSSKKVTDLISSKIWPSTILAVCSIVISTVFGLFLGTWSALRKGRFIDSFARIFSLTFLSFPIFSLAPLLIIIFSIKLELLPVSEWGSLRHMVLPLLTLALPLSSIVARVTRNRYLEEKSLPWVTVLSAKGLGMNAIVLRVIKAILPTIMTIVAIQLSVVLAGTIITESIFDIPGLGTLLFESIQNRDYPLLQGMVIYITIIYMGVYFVIDYINSKMDKRITM